MAGKTKRAKIQEQNLVVAEFLESKGLTYSQYVDNALWSAFREAVENKQSSALRRQVQEACEPQLIADAYDWKMTQADKISGNLVHHSTS
ncbi:hypothetical protein [Lactobacillus helveticus]|uniref:Uncharacterized protein n=1 Tax=Lactobacillus helveticus TaxID=1587 RepID=A0A6A7JZH4_LACHE|nr:hypothetical protein [Lactobacillus helveticus]MPW13743.1 hypothetical protein [Lactobacillus helveticus]